MTDLTNPSPYFWCPLLLLPVITRITRSTDWAKEECGGTAQKSVPNLWVSHTNSWVQSDILALTNWAKEEYAEPEKNQALFIVFSEQNLQCALSAPLTELRRNIQNLNKIKFFFIGFFRNGFRVFRFTGTTDWAKEKYMANSRYRKTESLQSKGNGLATVSLVCVGIDLFSRAVASQVSSALQSLTSVFGMGTGGPSA